jgi:hypothetical protein
MRETIEFRIPESRAARVLDRTDGLVLGKSSRVPVRKIVLPLDDPRVALIGRMERESRQQSEAFFTYWRIRREYTAQELEAAEILHLSFSSRFEPTGEECGTAYDYADVCPICGAGRRQTSPLVLNYERIPPSREGAETIAGDEWVVSERARDLFERNAITGVRLTLVRDSSRAGAVTPRWYQLEVTSPPVGVASGTQFGVNPFFEGNDARYRCPLGHVLGLNLISELHVRRDQWNNSDIGSTRQCVGMRQGLLVPHPLLLISGRTWRMLRDQQLTGFDVEVARLV